MLAKAFAACVAGVCLIAPALADETPPGTGDGRYTFNKNADGFVRLDSQTGDVSLCSKRAVGWACQAAPDERAVLEGEIARLRAQNAALKGDLLSRGLPLPPGALAEPPVAGANDLTIRLPSDTEVNRFAAYLGKVWHRLVDAITQAQKQVLDKS
jgi:hypothetical protein